MRFLSKICRRFFMWSTCFFSGFYLLRVRFITRIVWNGKLEIQSGSRFLVPVRTTISSGHIQLGQNIHFGFAGAPRQGNGEILLQARESLAVIRIGNNARFSNNVSIIARERIEIGDDFLCGEQVVIFDSDFHEISPEMRHAGNGKTVPVKIGRNVWIGSRCIIMKGSTIGDDSIIAAGSVVCGTIPARCIAAGVPARQIKSI